MQARSRTPATARPDASTASGAFPLHPALPWVVIGFCCVVVAIAFDRAGFPSLTDLLVFPDARPALRPGFSSVLQAPPVAPRLLLDIGLLPGIELRTALVGLHLIGLCFGLGGATMLDFWILRWLVWRALPDPIVRTFGFLAKVVTVGLVLLWVSGIGFLAIYAADAPEKLANPKIWAKVTIVLALTLNGLLLHATVIPLVLAKPQRPLLMDLSFGQRMIFIGCGAVSGVSWYAAFALGLLREFNNRVAAGQLLCLWLVSILAVAAVTALAFHLLLPRPGAAPMQGR